MANKSVLIRVPATVGNFGGAADCAALALDASLNVKVTPRLDGHVGIRYFGENGERVPRDRSNLVVRAMEAALHLKDLEFMGADFEIYSSVPVAVGLGSSTAAVLAGLLAADRLFRLQLDERTLFDLAGIYETRIDNMQAAWHGGFIACIQEGGQTFLRRTVVPENFSLHVVVPETVLAVAPPRMPHGAASAKRPLAEVTRGAESSPYAHRAASLADFFVHAGTANSADFETPLPPTCEKNVAGLAEALRVRAPGLLGAFVCGSGPAVGVFAAEDSDEAVGAVEACFARKGVASRAYQFRPTNAGAAEWNAVRAAVTLPASHSLSGEARQTSPLPV